MHIGILVWGLCANKGGTERIAVALANAMRERGHTITLFCQASPGTPLIPAFPASSDIPVVNLALSDGVSVQQARQTILDRDLDVFCVIYASDLLLWMMALLNNSGIPLLASEHHYPLMMDTVYWNRYERLACLTGADSIHMLSEHFAHMLPPFLKTRTTVIANPAEPPVPVDWEREKAPRKRLLSVGRLNEEAKQYSLLIQAFALVARKFPDWDLHICGEGHDEELYRQLAASLDLIPRIFLHGRTEDVESFYASAHLFCLSSRFEGYPLVILEAQRHALPVVGFVDCPGVNEIIAHGKNGLLAPAMTPQALAATLGVLMSQQAARRSMGEKGQDMLCRYEKTAIFDQWEMLLEKTAHMKNRTRLRIGPYDEETLSQNALAEILHRDIPPHRPDYLRTEGKINELSSLYAESLRLHPQPATK